jgi:hypothetical protein
MKDISEMIADLVEFYECAGFSDYYNRGLKGMSDDEIAAYHKRTFAGYDPETDTWEDPDAGSRDERHF